LKNAISKRCIVLITLICILIGCIPAVNADMLNYTPGDVLYYLNKDSIISQKGVTFGEDGVMHLEAGAKVTFEFFLPFDANRINFNYKRPDDRESIGVNLTMNSYKQRVSLNGFYEIRDFNLTRVAYTGDMRLTMEVDRPVDLYYVRFEKQPVLNWSIVVEHQGLGGEQFTGAYTDYEKALQTATVVNRNSSFMKINGAVKYINYDNISEKPYVENGEVYLPIKALALALGYYYEEDYASGYAMLRSDTMEYVLSDGKLYHQINSGSYNEITNNIIIKNNTIYAPIIYYAQAMGKSVAYVGDYVIVDLKTRIPNIVEGAFFEDLKTEFARYIGNKTMGNVYYVAQSENASDDNPGTYDSPWRTLAKAGQMAKAGDTVIIREGIYRETLAPQNNGTATAPIIFKAAENEKVTISATEEITATPYEEDGLLVYDMGDWDLGRGENQIFYKGNGIIEARHPNTNTSERAVPSVEQSPYFPTQGNILVRPDKGNTATSETDLDQETDYWAGGVLIDMHYAGYRLCWSDIESSEKGVLYLGDHNPYGYFADPSFEEETDWAYITCTKNAIDLPGEWYWGEGKLYMMAPEGETKDTLKLEAKKRMLTVDFSNSKYVQLQGINTFGGSMNLNDAELCVINGGEHNYVSHFTYLYDTAFWQDYVRAPSAYDSIQEDSPLNKGELGICISGKNNAVLNSIVRYSAGAGIITAGAYSHIENNYVSDTGYGGYYISGIDIHIDEKCFRNVEGGHSILYNSILKTGRSSVHIGGHNYPSAEDYGVISAVASEIAYNDCKEGVLYSRDGGMIYSYWSDLGNDIIKTKVHHNHVYDAWRDKSENAGISVFYWDNGVLNLECYNNIAFWTDESIERLGSEYFEQAYNGKRVHTTATTWGHMRPGIVPEGKAGLTPEDYAQYKVFNSGSTYDNVRQKTFDISYKGYNINDAVTSNGVTVSDNAAALNKAGEYITFKDVKFEDGFNAFAILYRGSQYNTGDHVKITLGDRETSPLVTTMQLTSEGASLKNNISAPVYMYGCEGTTDVTIESTKYASLEIAGIIPIKAEQSVIDEQIMGKTFAGNYAEILSDPTKTIVTSTQGTSGKADELAINAARGGSVIKYANVAVNRNVNNFVLAAGSSDTYAEDIVNVRIGSPDAKPIASIAVPGHGYSTFTPVEIPLNEVLPKGTYDIYLTFTDSSKTSNVWWFGFNVRREEASE